MAAGQKIPALNTAERGGVQALRGFGSSCFAEVLAIHRFSERREQPWLPDRAAVSLNESQPSPAQSSLEGITILPTGRICQVLCLPNSDKHGIHIWEVISKSAHCHHTAFPCSWISSPRQIRRPKVGI